MNRKLRIFALFAAGLFTLAGCASAPGATPTASPIPTPVPTLVPGDTERAVTVDGAQRMYLLHIPSSARSDQTLPLVLVFHDLFANAEYARQVTGFDDIADAHGFLVAYPNGSGPDPNSLSFNAGPCCGITAEHNIDDEAFVRMILSDIGIVARIDPRRIYSTGWGNGAFFSNRLGCDMSGTFAAIATVNGSLPYDPCQPERHVSIIHLHGLKDNFMPYAGGGRKIGTLDQPYPPARDVITAWAARDGCSNGTEETQEGLVTRIVFDGCPAGINVEIDTLSGIGHSWPSQYAVPASEMIWDFFAAHPKI